MKAAAFSNKNRIYKYNKRTLKIVFNVLIFGSIANIWLRATGKEMRLRPTNSYIGTPTVIAEHCVLSANLPTILRFINNRERVF